VLSPAAEACRRPPGFAAAGAASMAAGHRVLPTLAKMCAAIDQLFIVEVGPFGKQLAEDARTAWLESGNKMRPADVETYVALLAQHIEDAARREGFVSDALACIRL